METTRFVVAGLAVVLSLAYMLIPVLIVYYLRSIAKSLRNVDQNGLVFSQRPYHDPIYESQFLK